MLATLRNQTNLVLTITRYEHRFSGSVEQFKAVTHLVDGSRLHINEVWLQGQLHKYSYYWLMPAGELLQGWDNAPHHPEATTYPHHTHTPKGVMASQIRSLDDVLNEIEGHLLK